MHAQDAAKKVVVQYTELPAVLTIEQAIAAKAFFIAGRKLSRV